MARNWHRYRRSPQLRFKANAFRRKMAPVAKHGARIAQEYRRRWDPNKVLMNQYNTPRYPLGHICQAEAIRRDALERAKQYPKAWQRRDQARRANARSYPRDYTPGRETFKRMRGDNMARHYGNLLRRTARFRSPAYQLEGTPYRSRGGRDHAAIHIQRAWRARQAAKKAAARRIQKVYRRHLKRDSPYWRSRYVKPVWDTGVPSYDRDIGEIQWIE